MGRSFFDLGYLVGFEWHFRLPSPFADEMEATLIFIIFGQPFIGGAWSNVMSVSRSEPIAFK
jgi:hypothetical protein